MNSHPARRESVEKQEILDGALFAKPAGSPGDSSEPALKGETRFWQPINSTTGQQINQPLPPALRSGAFVRCSAGGRLFQ